jgi:ribonucleoside-diphosphate reductase alpha chain
MRSLQFGGKSIEISPNRIYNCAYLPIDDWRAFSETMFLLLGGTGVGFSVQRHHVDQLPEIRKPNSTRSRRYLIGDSIEGWADAIKILMRSYFEGMSTPDFDYSDIRQKGALLVTSGGRAPGPQPLKDCIHNIKKILDTKEDSTKLTPIECHDIICFIADAVLTGGIRRAALISLFSIDDEEMLAAKSGAWWELNPQRGRANNSAVILRHKITEEKFYQLWKKIEDSNSGEPGVYFSNDKDWGTNPCCEIGLRPYQFCNLCEVNVSDIESQEDLEERAKAAAFIGTLQAGYTDFHYLRDVWKRTTEKDALIGVGMTGIGSGEVLNQSNNLNNGAHTA